MKASSKIENLKTEDLVMTPVEIERTRRARKKKTSRKDAFMPTNPSKIFTAMFSSAILLLALIVSILVVVLVNLREIELKNFASYRNITISTTPEDADIYINNHYVGISPITFDNFNLSETSTIKIRKGGYNDETLIIKNGNVKSKYDIVLTPKDSAANKITWSDFGLQLNVPEAYTESLSLETASCKEVKNYLVDKKKCPTDATTLNYNAKILNFEQNSKNYKMTLKLPTNTDLCTINISKCSNAKKLETVNVLNQSMDVYEVTANGITTVFLQADLKTEGKDYNGVYIEFNGKVDYKNILKLISKNA